LRRVDPAIGDAELRQEQPHLVDIAGIEIAVERQHRRFLPETRCLAQHGQHEFRIERFARVVAADLAHDVGWPEQLVPQ
jgi:hypothetical protein